jgi:hypothetical protein
MAFKLMFYGEIDQCVTADFSPKFEQVPGSHGFKLLVMEYPGGKKEIARGDSRLLDQVEQHCLSVADAKFAKNIVAKLKSW